jgi:hypothetical protein
MPKYKMELVFEVYSEDIDDGNTDDDMARKMAHAIRESLPACSRDSKGLKGIAKTVQALECQKCVESWEYIEPVLKERNG